MRKLLVFLLSVMLILGLVGCGSGNDNSTAKTEVVIWHTWTDHHAEEFQKIIDEYNETIDDYKIVVQAQPLQDFDSKVMQAVRNGTGPDIIFTYPTVASNYIGDGLIVDLSQFIDDETIGIPGFQDSLTGPIYEEVTQWDGNVYLIPIVKTGEVLYYNKTLLDELGFDAPQTWTDVENAARAAYEATGKPGFGFDAVIDGATALIIQAGSGYIDVENKVVLFDNEVAAERIQWFGDLVQEGVFRLVGEDGYFSNPFGSQAVAMYVGSSAGVNFVMDAANGAFEVGITGLPQEGPNKYASSWGTNAMVFTSDSAKEQAAYEFIKYFTSPEISANWAIMYGGATPYAEAQEVAAYVTYVEENPAVAALMQTMEAVGYLPAVTGSTTVRTELGKAAEEVATGMKDAATALADAANVCNAELQ